MVERTHIADRYEIVRPVGHGGMGAVCLAVDTLLGREVALKQVGGFPGDDASEGARALREARSVAALNHPNVIAIFDAVEADGRIWLVMEYLPSRTLEQLLEQEGPLGDERVARIGAQVASGLAHAHERGLVHRDVKPSNILITERDRAKVSDFGIARGADDEALTQSGLVLGTPLYFSPEMARGAEPGPASDVWALGATLFFALEGAPPWPRHGNSIALLSHIAQHPPAVPTRSGPVADVIEATMVTDVSLRPSMTEVRDRLRECRDHRSLSRTRALTVSVTAPVPVLQPLPTPTARRRSVRWAQALLGAAALGAAAVAISVLLPIIGSDDVTARDSSPAPEGSRESSVEAPSSPTQIDPSPSDETEVSPVIFVLDYYELLPDDPETAWERLGESVRAQSGSYEAYRDFWASIDGVRAAIVAKTEDGAEVDVVYSSAEGVKFERRRLTVASTEQGLQIVADDVTS